MKRVSRDLALVRDIVQRVVENVRPDLQLSVKVTDPSRGRAVIVSLRHHSPFIYTVRVPKPVGSGEIVEAEILRFVQFASPRELEATVSTLRTAAS